MTPVLSQSRALVSTLVALFYFLYTTTVKAAGDPKGGYVAQTGSRFRLARVQAGMTLRQAEEETGLSKDTISRIERGLRNPQPLTAAKLAEAYGHSVEEFLEAPKHPPRLRQRCLAPRATNPGRGGAKPWPVFISLDTTCRG